MIDAAAAHARHEAEVGGYVAAEAAAPVLDAGRAAVAALTGFAAADVVFTTGSNHALDICSSATGVVARTLACLPGEYGPNLLAMARHGFDVAPAPRRRRRAASTSRPPPLALAADPPALVHFTALGSHRGIVQPIAAVAAVCRDVGHPADRRRRAGVRARRLRRCRRRRDVLLVAQVDGGAARRRVLAARAGAAERSGARRSSTHAEANVAAQVGFSVALGEHVAAGPEQIRAGWPRSAR